MTTISRERRRHVVRLVRRVGVLHDERLSRDAKLLYIVGALVCDDAGRMSQPAVVQAMNDPDVMTVAEAILATVGPTGRFC